MSDCISGCKRRVLIKRSSECIRSLNSGEERKSSKNSFMQAISFVSFRRKRRNLRSVCRSITVVRIVLILSSRYSFI